jgi:DNA invertase Pin-like site-specific DNA recombinase
MISPSQVRGRPVNRARWARLLAGSLAETPEPGRPPAEATPCAVGPPPYIFGYIRVSDFERQENSEAVQEDLIDKRAAIADIPGTYVGCLVDYLSSKQFPFDQRPHGQWLLRNVRSGDSIIVTKMDRFGRTLGDMTETIERLYDRGAAIYILNHGGTPLAVDSTVGRAMIGFLAVSARLENDLRADRIRETIAYRKAKGLPYYKHPPFGKRTEVYTDESGRRQKRWVRDDQQCRLLMEMYDLRYKRGWSLAQIAELLDRRGAKDQKGSPWSWRRPCNGTWQVNKLRKAVEYVRSLLQVGKEL